MSEPEALLEDLAVVGRHEAWLTTLRHLYRWDGEAWVIAGRFADGHGRTLMALDDAIFVLGQGEVYRRFR